MECEFSDEDVTVLMITPENTEEEIWALERALVELPRRSALPETERILFLGASATAESIRSAMLAPRKTVPVKDAVGRICATPTVSCPPAVPIAVSGDVITEEQAELFLRYGMDGIDVVM